MGAIFLGLLMFLAVLPVMGIVEYLEERETRK